MPTTIAPRVVALGPSRSAASVSLRRDAFGAVGAGCEGADVVLAGVADGGVATSVAAAFTSDGLGVLTPDGLLSVEPISS